MAYERRTQELFMSKAESDDEEQRAGSSAHDREDVSIEAVAAASTMQALHTEPLAPGTTDTQSLVQAPTPPPKAGPTMEDVYKRIMEQKSKAADGAAGTAAAEAARPAAAAHVMQSSSLVPIPSLDQDLTATHLDIDSRAFASRVFGSSSLEEFDALIGHNDDSLFELIRGLSVEQQEVIEALQAGGPEQAPPQQVKALIRTMTLEKLFGGDQANQQVNGRKHHLIDQHEERPKRHRLTVSSGPEGLPCAGPAPRGESEHGNQPSSSLAARVLQSSTLAEFDALVAQNDDVLYDLAGALPAEEQRLVQQLLEREHVPPQQVKSHIRSLMLDRMFGNQAQHRMSMEGGATQAADHSSLHHQPGTHSHASFSQQGIQGQARRSGLGAARLSENGVSQAGFVQQLQGQAQVQGKGLQLMQQHAEQQQQQQQQQLQRLSEGGRPPQCSGAGGLQERFPSRRLSHAEPLQPQPQHSRGLMLDLGSALSPSLSSAALPSPGNARSPPPNGCTGQGDLVLAMKLQTKAESLAAENGSLQSCLHMLLRHLEAVQRDNEAMKGVLLRAAAVSGISAEMEHLEQTIDMHRPPPVDDEQAATLAARVLSSNKGNVDAAIQQLLLTAVSRSKVGTQTMPPSAAAPPRQQQQQQQQQLQLQLHTQRQGQGQEGIVLGQGLEQGLRLGLGQGLGLRVGQAQGQPQGQYSLAPLQRRELYAGNAGNGTGDRSGGGGGGGFQRLETQALFAPQLRPLALARTASGGSGSFLVRQDSQGQLLVMQQMPAVQPQLVSYNQAGMGVGGGSGLGQGFGLDLSQPNFARGGAPISFGASSVPTLSASQLSADRVSSAAGGGGLRRQPSVVQALQRQSSLTGVQVHDVFGGQGAGLNALVSMPTAVRLVPIGQQGLGPLAAQLRHQQQQRQLQQFQY